MTSSKKSEIFLCQIFTFFTRSSSKKIVFSEDFGVVKSLQELILRELYFHYIFDQGVLIREGRTWAIAVRRGSSRTLFLLSSGLFFCCHRKE